ncbi:MAG: metallophosphoesterase [Chlorobiaceae bacterium]|nr:metallophosphoesterase [Chlorobiaceae bacterium]NTW74184.1 metallophosphoesterase [Chlorobiaceae bacterium]
MSKDKNVRVAHLSDLHLAGKNDRRQLERLDLLLAEIVRKEYDHLVITGDLIDTANTEDWLLIREALLRHGLFELGRTTVLPGNHDLINLEEEMRFYHALNPDVSGRRRRVNDRLARFCQVFLPLISEDGQGPAGYPLVKVLRFGEISLALVAVSSVLPWSGSDNPLGARGFVAPEILRALVGQPVIDALSGSFIIGLCHHAYRVYGTDALIDQAFDWTMEFKNRDDFFGTMKLLQARLVMHGHFHRFQVYSVEGLTFINGGSFRYSPERYGEVEIDAAGNWAHRFLKVGETG